MGSRDGASRSRSRAHLLPRERVPDFRGEIGGSRRRERRRSVQASAPDRPLVALEGADPVAGVALAKHGLSI